MKSCLKYWPEIAARVKSSELVFLALDYDGVLAPIAARPGLAVLPPANRALLERLVKSARARVAIISGRSLSDIKKRVKVPAVIYAGNHGSEIDLHGAIQAHIGVKNYREKLTEARNQLDGRFRAFTGLLLEDKGFGIGVHYRELAPAQLEAFHQQFSQWAARLPEGLQIVHAKKMYEVRPSIAWNKGNAVRYLWQVAAPDALPICLGDDLTDEDGFRALQGIGINIFVGEERQSYAEYILPTTAEVTTFLERLLKELER